MKDVAIVLNTVYLEISTYKTCEPIKLVVRL